MWLCHKPRVPTSYRMEEGRLDVIQMPAETNAIVQARFSPGPSGDLAWTRVHSNPARQPFEDAVLLCVVRDVVCEQGYFDQERGCTWASWGDVRSAVRSRAAKSNRVAALKPHTCHE